MALLPRMSQKAANEDKSKFQKLITTFRRPPEDQENWRKRTNGNYIEFDDSYKPTQFQKFQIYLEYLDEEDNVFPKTHKVLE
jgi:hypothetical protein